MDDGIEAPAGLALESLAAKAGADVSAASAAMPPTPAAAAASNPRLVLSVGRRVMRPVNRRPEFPERSFGEFMNSIRPKIKTF
jgi:hypothetical protein